MKFDTKLLEEAAAAALDSDDPRTSVGCVIYNPKSKSLIRAANKVPSGLFVPTDDERLKAPAKYIWIEHAERAAIYRAACDGISTRGSSLYVHGGFPCADCARAIVAAGISTVAYCIGASDVQHWEASYRISRHMFEAARIRVMAFPEEDRP